ncbi:putative secreted protein [Lederbergia lenta]|uniref:Putative secreted protein n=1 Tax=Lederbergia lenta TaxID=1467 RepID=A0A2X4WG48_LEDLE|nr:putative secreted protein [Lederbergia lenta]
MEDNSKGEYEIDHKNHGSSHHNHGTHHVDRTNMKNEVNVLVHYEGNLLTINLKDQNGNAPELEVSHEKLFHLIIVSSDLQQYDHLHPVDKGNGVFKQEISLKEDLYKVFVDVSPKNLGYQIKPIDLHIGHGHYHG